MSRSGWLLPTVTVFFGVLSAGCGMLFLKAQENPDGERKILVFKRNLESHHKLTVGDIDETSIPNKRDYDAIFNAALKKDDLPRLLDVAILTEPVLENQFVTSAQLTQSSELAIKPGYCALQIPGSIAPTLLVPGDLVKILVTRPLPDEEGQRPPVTASAAVQAAYLQHVTYNISRKFETREVLKSVKVLAIGHLFFKNRIPQTGDSEDANANVTVEVCPEQAAKILTETGAFTHPVTLLINGPSSTTSKTLNEEDPACLQGGDNNSKKN